ncbi:nitroreductase [Microbulbifer sp. S227A]|uniref:nitroreductase n=1 Tax=Microbulbifer sp. S227A TaxID=3415131 RepID=UPI003C7D6A49
MSELSPIDSRVSTRAFKDTPVPQALLNDIFTRAQQSPSNCNVQPWQTFVVSGIKKDALKQRFIEELMKGEGPKPDFDWSVKYAGVHRERQFGSANALYSAMGIAREDKNARQMAMVRNWEFFGAPHAAFFVMDKYLGIMGAVDIGIYAQTLALLLEEHGLGSCFQGALGQFPAPAREMFGLSEDQGILFGMSFGYPDETAAANTARTERATLSEAVTFIS